MLDKLLKHIYYTNQDGETYLRTYIAVMGLIICLLLTTYIEGL